MDHMEQDIRAVLDGWLYRYAYLSYAAKYASTFYGPFPVGGGIRIFLGRLQELPDESGQLRRGRLGSAA